jgi:nuclear pore complex protein Nup98-Nup96
MSGFGGFGSGGFGANQNQTTSAFGGFGSTATSGFAANSNTNNPTSAFGGGNTGGSMFGNTSNTNTGFGGGGKSFLSNPITTSLMHPGFGASTANASPFGQSKPAFGAATSSPSLFGGGGGTTTANNTFGGFGGGASTGGFGAGTNSAFGASAKPAFGASAGSLFGASTSNTAFGGTTQPATGGFGGGSPFSTNQQNNGTGTTPFAPHVEKEQNSTQSNSFQTITAMPAYNKYSLEELRCVDYAQGRKYGNQSGQAGAFGTSTGFGGFGTSTQNTTTNAFGASSTGGGGLFGGNTQAASTPFGGTSNTAFGGTSNTSPFGQKPAATSLFGGTTPAASTTGGLFGGSGGGGGFGGNTSTGFGGGGGGGASTFGQQQNKPFSGFGATTGGFGASSTTPFGGQQNTSPFGGNAQSNAAGTTGFGQQNQQQTQAGGSLFSGFGQQQQKPSLFGGTTANTGGLFGQPAAQQPQTGGLFGGNQQQSGGLFGNKPAATTSLFGGQAQNTGSSMFGNQQQNQGSSLFGANNQAGSGLLGAKPAASGLGGSLFGQNQNQGQASMFSSAQPQSTGLGGSLFGSTQQTPQNQPSHLVANLTENPYGNAQLFAGLQTPTQNLGPLATPLSSTQKTKKQAIIPHHRIMPLASSRLITPQKRVQGYGFTYSAFNSPASVGSNSSPLGLGNSLLGSTSLNRSLGKSLSTSNLRHSFTAQDSILAPGAFSGASRSGAGSMKKLNINRGLSARRSLFGPETTNPGKRVSFDPSVAPNGERPAVSTALVRTESPEADRSPPVRSQPTQPNGAGKELAAVPENNVMDQALHVGNAKAQLAQHDQAAGDYITRPSIAEIQAMRREDRANIRNFMVAREGMGSVTFSKADLTGVPLADICGKIVQIDMRRATVYGDNSPVQTPPQGQGLNVRSRIVLENSWPRKLGRTRVPDHSEQALEKHVRLLKTCKDTTFVSYEAARGVWTFDVEHFTTYGLDYEDDGSPVENSMMLQRDSPNSPAVYSPGSESSVEDTFDFKRKRTAIPGQFEGEALLDASMDDVDADEGDANSFVYDDVDDDDQEMAGSFPAGDAMVFEAPAAKLPPVQEEDELRISKNWTNQLLQTASPKKDRQSLARHADAAPERRPLEQVATFGTAVDIMKSLFASQSQEEVSL